MRTLISRGCKRSMSADVSTLDGLAVKSGVRGGCGGRLARDPQRRHGAGIVSAGEDRRPGDQHIRSRCDNLRSVIDFHSAIDFEQGSALDPIQHLANSGYLLQHGRNKFLPAESGVHGHDQHKIDIPQNILQQADLAKFAKAIPAEEFYIYSMDFARAMVCFL